MKKSETLQVNISELNQYVDKSEDKSNHPVTNWMSLRSQVQVDGLKSLHNALEKGSSLSLQELKNHHAQGLLHDLEMVSKRQEGNK